MNKNYKLFDVTKVFEALLIRCRSVLSLTLRSESERFNTLGVSPNGGEDNISKKKLDNVAHGLPILAMHRIPQYPQLFDP